MKAVKHVAIDKTSQFHASIIDKLNKQKNSPRKRIKYMKHKPIQHKNKNSIRSTEIYITVYIKIQLKLMFIHVKIYITHIFPEYDNSLEKYLR